MKRQTSVFKVHDTRGKRIHEGNPFYRSDLDMTSQFMAISQHRCSPISSPRALSVETHRHFLQALLTESFRYQRSKCMNSLMGAVNTLEHFYRLLHNDVDILMRRPSPKDPYSATLMFIAELFLFDDTVIRRHVKYI